MKCLICNKKIESGEKIFGGSQGVCLGEADWSFSGIGEGLAGMIHLSCLVSSVAVVRTPNLVVSEPDDEYLVVRSDALSIFEGVGT